MRINTHQIKHFVNALLHNGGARGGPPGGPA
jgi:hypothetical protein